MPEAFKVKDMWWEGNTLFIETVEGETWAFEDARMVALEREFKAEDGVVVEDVPLTFEEVIPDTLRDPSVCEEEA